MWLSFGFLVLMWTLRVSLAQSPPVVGPAWTVSPFHPHAIPLAVRSPYLNSWIVGGNGSGPLGVQWPTLWNMKSVLAWSLYVKVDNTAYKIMGDDALANGSQAATQTSFSFTVTQTKFVHTAGGMNISTSFISPIEPSNLVLQSLPAAYMAVSAQSNDGNRHRVQVYSDITAEWISGDSGLNATWDTTTSSSSIIHSVRLQNPQPFVVVNDHVQDATAYYGIINGNGISWQNGNAGTSRSQFITQGVLQNTKDTTFRAINSGFPAFGLAVDLGQIATSNAPVAFALGLIRDPAVRTLSATAQAEDRSLYFFTQFSNAFDAMNYFISDFGRAVSAASNFDTSIRNAASAVSSDYADLIDLSARQVFAMIEITAGKDSEGNWNQSDVQAFMNDVHGRVSTVDVMYPAFPLFLQTNPTIAGALLKPLLQWQQANGFPHPWAAQDLGQQYPTALGDTADTNDLNMPVEESANMLIMTLAQARMSGDATLISSYYDILDKWAQYLVPNAINPGDQNFTDYNLTGPVVNDTNLSLKGILGIQAMAEIATATNNSVAATKYSGIASGLLTQWQTKGFSADKSHLLLGFGNETSSLGLPYNLYADKLLGLNMIPQRVYDQVAAFVKSQIQPFGVALDSRSSTASKTDWTLFTAAALSDTDARNALISSVRKYAANLPGPAVPFSDFYDIAQGTSIGFQNRPVQGAMFAILALQVPSKPIVLPPPLSTAHPSPSSPPNTKNSSALSDRSPSLMYILALMVYTMLGTGVL